MDDGFDQVLILTGGRVEPMVGIVNTCIEFVLTCSCSYS